ncbi:MAG TPA: CoA transferase [Novosphingobium sp.]|nr:CoA transferase [Novosphingobium sp.]
MVRPLEGIKVVEVSTWAYVPSCGAALADMGADVVKIETPAGDPIRQLTMNDIPPGTGGFTFMYEIFNRGKRSVAIDLNAEGAIDVLYRLLETADVFLTNLLPPTRRKLKIDADHLTKRFPHLIYAAGSGQGARGPDAEKGGYDAISLWSRSGLASAATPDNAPYPPPMPVGAIGDVTSGLVLAGAISAAIARRAMTGEALVVDGSLLSTGMWMMQPSIVGTQVSGTDELRMAPREQSRNPLVGTFYRTKDRRFVCINMMQSQRYWPGLCRALGRPELAEDERFGSDALRYANVTACMAELDAAFGQFTLEEVKERLATQEGQWDVVQKASDLLHDVAVNTNGYLPEVDYGDGRRIRMVAAPMQFGGEPLQPRPAPELGADSDAVLAGAGYSEEDILNLRIAGVLE